MTDFVSADTMSAPLACKGPAAHCRLNPRGCLGPGQAAGATAGIEEVGGEPGGCRGPANHISSTNIGSSGPPQNFVDHEAVEESSPLACCSGIFFRPHIPSPPS